MITETNVCINSQAGKPRGTELFVLNTGKSHVWAASFTLIVMLLHHSFNYCFLLLQLVFSGLFMPLLDLLLIKDIWDRNSAWTMLHTLHLAKKVISSLLLTKQRAALPLTTNPSYHLSSPYYGVVSNNAMSGIVLCAKRNFFYNHRHTLLYALWAWRIHFQAGT